MNHGHFFKLLAGMKHTTKEDLVWTFSDQQTESLREFYLLSPIAYQKMIAHMENSQKPNDKEEIKKYRSSILHRLQKHGVDTTDWSKVNHFLEQPRVCGKRLYDMSVEEMKNLIPKLESILRKDKTFKNHIEKISKLN